MAIAILGATSAIGQEIAKVLVSRGEELILFARNPTDPSTRKLDVLGFDDGTLKADLESKGPLDGVILCVGYLGDNLRAMSQPDEAARITDTNFTGSARALDVAATLVRDGGFVLALSSVAGDRPRKKIFYYAKAKAALNDHLDRMRARLSSNRIRVITIKLGSVDTRMTAHRKRSHPFVVSAPQAAEQIVDASQSTNGVVYLPGKWKLIMSVMKLLPSGLYNRL